MALWDWFRRKASAQTGMIVLGIGDYVVPDFQYVSAARESYERNITAYAAINLRARCLSGIPWVLMRKGKTATSKVEKVMSLRGASRAWNTGHPDARKAVAQAEIEDHPILALLERPNPIQRSGTQLLRLHWTYLLLAGNAYLEAAGPTSGPNSGRPRELYTMRPDRIEILTHSVNLVRGYNYTVNGQKRFFQPEQVLHEKFPHSTDDLLGLSPLQVAMRMVATANLSTQWNLNLLKNSARPATVVTYQGTMPDPQYERFKRQIDEDSGPSGAGRPWLIESGAGGIDVKPLGFSPAEMEWLAGWKVTKRELCLVWGVYPELLGDSENKTFSNFKEARAGFYVETVLPDADLLRDDLNAWLVPKFGDGIRLDYDRDQIEALHEEQNSLWARIREAEHLTTNEKRRATGYDDYVKVDGERNPGDVILVSAARQALEDLVLAERAQPEPEPEPQPTE